MTLSNNENEALVRRLSDDIHQFKTNHHLPDDLESSINSHFFTWSFFEYVPLFD